MNNLPKVRIENTKRVGRGVGSGKGGHTTGRGQKGQKSRYDVHILFEGVKTRKSLLHRLPFLRGKERNKRYSKPITISTDKLVSFKKGEEITLEALINAGLVSVHDANKHGVKIVKGSQSVGEYTLSVPSSKGTQMNQNA